MVTTENKWLRKQATMWTNSPNQVEIVNVKRMEQEEEQWRISLIGVA